MRQYKHELQQRLISSGWEIEETDSETEWWLEEIWKIKSVKQDWGFSLHIHFLVELQYEGAKKASAVWCVTALGYRAESYAVEEDSIANLYLQNGRFDENINRFIEDINNERNKASK